MGDDVNETREAAVVKGVVQGPGEVMERLGGVDSAEPVKVLDCVCHGDEFLVPWKWRQ